MNAIPKAWFLCLLLALTGCLTEVDPRDVDFEPVLVVQSFPQPGHPVTLQLSRTTPLWDPSRYLVVNTSPTDSFYVWDRTPDLVAGAEVRLSVNAETDYLLHEDSTGFYSLPLSMYFPAAQDRLQLTIKADQLRATAETVIPKPTQDYAFSWKTMPIAADTVVAQVGPDTYDTVYVYDQDVSATLSFSDPANQSDYYLFTLEQVYARRLPGSDPLSQCGGGPLPQDVLRYSLMSDIQRQGAHFTVQKEWRVSTRFQETLFPDAADRTTTCTLRASLVQYGPAYDRFLQIAYQPSSSETGSNIQGGLGLFTGIVIRNTTFIFGLGTSEEP